MKYRRRARFQLDLDTFGMLLGLPGKVVRVGYNERYDCLDVVLEGEQFPKIYVGEMIEILHPVFTVIPIKELLNMPLEEILRRDVLRESMITQVSFDDC